MFQSCVSWPLADVWCMELRRKKENVQAVVKLENVVSYLPESLSTVAKF